MTRRTTRGAASLAILCALVACATNEPAAEPVDEPEVDSSIGGQEEIAAPVPGRAVDTTTALASIASAPIAADPGVDTIWAYLLGRYDTDGDGTLTRAEYDRKEGQFATWDRDGSGTLTEADFERKRRGDRGRDVRDESKGKARRMLARYFQEDDDAGELSLDEAKAAFARYDGSDGSEPDGAVGEGEFTCAMEERLREVPGDDSLRVRRTMRKAEPWPTLLAGLDEDASETLEVGELVAFYGDAVESDVIRFTERSSSRRSGSDTPRSRGLRGRLAGEGELAAQEGRPAPDFTLSSPDGEHTMTLSRYRGSKPVALIFGSYT